MDFTNKEAFRTALLARDDVVKITEDVTTKKDRVTGKEEPIEVSGEFRKGFFKVIFQEPGGKQNIRQVWYLENTETGEIDFQTEDMIAQVEAQKANRTKYDVLVNYLNTNYPVGWDILSFNPDQLRAIAQVYAESGDNIDEKRVLVYRSGGSVVDKDIV